MEKITKEQLMKELSLSDADMETVTGGETTEEWKKRCDDYFYNKKQECQDLDKYDSKAAAACYEEAAFYYTNCMAGR